MRKSGLADSPFFKPSSKIETTNSPALSSPKKKKRSVEQKSSNRRKPVTSRHHDIMTSINQSTNPSINHDVNQPTNHDVMLPRHHATTVEIIRSALKTFGKEATTIRFTQEEKKGIEDLVYAYKKRNIKTNANEITRIGVNYILNDHKQKGKQSLLDLVVKALIR